MPALENVFSWSKSRDEQFRECARKYYYDKYLSWGGWDRSAPENVRQAYVLKNLKNRWAWKGEVVHHEVENILKALRAGQKVAPEIYWAHLSETMRNDFRSAKAGKNWQDPKRQVGLFEMEYKKPIEDAVWKDFHDSSLDCLKNFTSSIFYQELLVDDKKNWLLIEDLEAFYLHSSKIYVKLDFARRKDGVIQIYDWKTGREEGGAEAAEIQLGTYALYAMDKWKVPLEQIQAYLVFLSQPNPIPTPQSLTQALLDQTRAFIQESTSQMKKLLSNPEKNIPLPMEQFAYTASPKLCAYCHFQKICDKAF